MKLEYIEVSPQGVKTKGIISALSENEAVDLLQKEGNNGNNITAW